MLTVREFWSAAARIPAKADESRPIGSVHGALYRETLVTEKEANRRLVKVAYGIGRREPEKFTIMTDKGDFSSKFHDRFVGLFSQQKIIDVFRLRNPTGTFETADPQTWTYFQTAAYGHYGRDIFPWEQAGRFKK